MALDLSAIVRSIGGTCIEHRLSDRTPIDGLAALDDYVVVGNPDYATLLTGSDSRLLSLLETGGDARDALLGAVFVTHLDTPQLRAGLESACMTAILGARLSGPALHATLSALIADERAAGDRLVTSGMSVLTQAARRGGTTAVIAELARRIDGWAVLLDAQGHLIASAGAGRLHIADAVAVALGRPVRVRHSGLQLHQVGLERDRAGTLVIATRSSRTSHARDLASLAAALFDLLLRTHDPSLTEHLGRAALLDTLLAGGDHARDLLRRWGVHESELIGFALGSRSRNVDLERLLRRWFDELGAEHVFAVWRGRITGFVRADIVVELENRAASFTPVSGPSVHLGIGATAPVDALTRSAVQAAQALEAAMEQNQPVLRYARLPTVDLVLSGLSEAPRADLAGLLDPLYDADGSAGELARTLRVYLSEHGAHRASAARLGIHRQTLVSRVRRIEELTGLAFDQADDRAAAWLALRAAGL